MTEHAMDYGLQVLLRRLDPLQPAKAQNALTQGEHADSGALILIYCTCLLAVH